MTQKTCGACGETFDCAAPARGCWCESVALNPETLAALRLQYDNCLCPRCLATHANEPQPLQP